MTPQESTTAFRALKTWQRVRNFTGLLVIFAGIATAVTGIVALKNERDTSSAMKLSVALALVCIVSFVHAQKKILAMRKPNSEGRVTR
jgi:hypothetical protein